VSTGNRARSVRRLLFLAAGAALLLMGAATGAWAQFGGFGGMRPAPATGLFGWLLGQQAFFYQALAGMLRAAKNNGSAYWGLIGVSFIYGVFHAAGPGHGKAVISSYLLANEETWRRGVTLSFASAVLQSLAAITIVAVAAFLIGATAKMMGDAVRTIETVSYVIIILIGARLLWVKGKSFRTALLKARAEREPAKAVAVENGGAQANACCHAHGHENAHSPVAHAHHDHAPDEHAHTGHGHHGHHHDHDDEEGSVLPWGHAHGPEPEELAGPGGWRRGLSTIVAVGLRPCSGAIIILVFALSQGLFWAGIASTFVMGLGTAITVGTIASLAVGAKSFAKRISGRPTGYSVLMLRGFEVGAACLVMLVGVALLTGYMASEQMGFF
jgi:nickel/cobalt transporter (NicO) family protein